MQDIWTRDAANEQKHVYIEWLMGMKADKIPRYILPQRNPSRDDVPRFILVEPC